MTGEDFARLAYLVILLAAVGGITLTANRGQLGQMLRYALIWGLVFLGFLAAFALWQSFTG